MATKLIELRQEGSVETGPFLLADLLDEGTGKQTCWEVDIKTGEIGIGTIDVLGDVFSLNRPPTPDEQAAINAGYERFKLHGPTGPPVPVN